MLRLLQKMIYRDKCTDCGKPMSRPYAIDNVRGSRECRECYWGRLLAVSRPYMPFSVEEVDHLEDTKKMLDMDNVARKALSRFVES